MAAPSKRRAVEQEMVDLELEESDADESNDATSEDESLNEEVQVDFEARGADDRDFHGIRALLHQLFLKANVNISEMTDTILEQNFIGSVLQQASVSEEEGSDDDGEATVFGVTSVINIAEKKKLNCFKEMSQLLLTMCSKHAEKQWQTLYDTLSHEASPIGFIINERYINIPPQVALPTFESLWKDVDNAKTKKMKYDFSKYLMICKTYKMPQMGKKGKKKKGAAVDLGETMFVNQEEEFFHQEASMSFDYSVRDQRDTGVSGKWDDEEEGMEPFRTVMIIPAEKIPVIMTKLNDVLRVT